MVRQRQTRITPTMSQMQSLYAKNHGMNVELTFWNISSSCTFQTCINSHFQNHLQRHSQTSSPTTLKPTFQNGTTLQHPRNLQQYSPLYLSLHNSLLQRRLTPYLPNLCRAVFRHIWYKKPPCTKNAIMRPHLRRILHRNLVRQRKHLPAMPSRLLSYTSRRDIARTEGDAWSR